ncbi:hypothetical protein [Aquibacillus rhizosphaerae]|uniref:Uncharacterized protein n=1 Tax=Aquibacillus rhizosphaerae TaxID=3051431 RepID=A0ABT7L400_9BACI|nr:hypothetical protein [Aquibacillus sp. LR5S19]MDL4839902.1 hypothetical protein [Aquibacillus sp. LR5S19]
MDAFSGYPIQIDYYGAVDRTGELLDIDKVQEKVSMMLHRIYGEDKRFSVEYLGINVNYSSNMDDQYYTFAYKPMLNSMPLYAFSDQSNKIYFDARSGDFGMMHSIPSIPFSLNDHEIFNKVITPEEGLYILKRKVNMEDKKLVETRNYTFIDTFVVYSSTSGGLVPVHAYGISDHDSTWRYINIEHGKEEMLYFEN